MNEVIFTPWDQLETPTEESLRDRLVAEGLQPERWSNASGERYPVQSHEYIRVVYCVEGSVWFSLTDEHDRTLELEPGDRIEIPAGVRHSIMAGMDGVTCLEGHR